MMLDENELPLFENTAAATASVYSHVTEMDKAKNIK